MIQSHYLYLSNFSFALDRRQSVPIGHVGEITTKGSCLLEVRSCETQTHSEGICTLRIASCFCSGSALLTVFLLNISDL